MSEANKTAARSQWEGITTGDVDKAPEPYASNASITTPMETLQAGKL